jgi:thiamine biosynthesis lipoprotein
MAPGTQLDLGATARAVAADRCARLVHETLGGGVLVSLGGDVATARTTPRTGWQVTVQDLPSDVPQQITLHDGAAVATSSSVRRTWSQDGRRRAHLVDPLTRLPAAGPWSRAGTRAPRGEGVPAAGVAPGGVRVQARRDSSTRKPLALACFSVG